MKKTIQIDEDLKKKLDELKIHPRQSYNEIIKMLVKQYDRQN